MVDVFKMVLGKRGQLLKLGLKLTQLNSYYAQKVTII